MCPNLKAAWSILAGTTLGLFFTSINYPDALIAPMVVIAVGMIIYIFGVTFINC